MEQYTMPMPNEKVYVMLHFTCQPLAFKRNFNCLLVVQTNQLTIKGTDPLLLRKAITHINYICTLAIDQQPYDLKQVRQTNETQNQYYRSWSNSHVRQLYEKYRVMLIPRHAIRDILGRVDDTLRYYCVSTDTNKNKQFMKEYNGINILRHPEQNSLNHSSVSKKQKIMMDFKQFICLRIIGQPDIMQIANIVCRGRFGLFGDNLPLNINEVCKEYVLEEQSMVLKQYLKIVNSPVFVGLVHPIEARLIFQVDFVNEANKYYHYRSVRQDKVYFIRRRDTPPLQDILKNFNLKIQKTKKTLILETNDLVRLDLDSKLREQMMKYIPEQEIETIIHKQDIVSINYKSQLNINAKILDFMIRMRKVQRIELPFEVVSAFQKTFYRSKMEKIANQQNFLWHLANHQSSTYFTFRGYNGQPYNVLKKLNNFVNDINILTYTIEMDDEDVSMLEPLRRDIEQQLNKLSIKEAKVRISGKNIEIEGIVLQAVIHQETLKEINGLLNKKSVDAFTSYFRHPYEDIILQLEDEVLSESDFESSVQSSFSRSISQLSSISEVRRSESSMSEQMSILNEITKDRRVSIPDVVFFGLETQLKIFKREDKFYIAEGTTEEIAQLLDRLVYQLNQSVESTKLIRYLDQRERQLQEYMQKNRLRMKVYDKSLRQKAFVDWKIRILTKLRKVEIVDIFQGFFSKGNEIRRSQVADNSNVTYGFYYQEHEDQLVFDHLKEYRIKAE